MKSMLFVLVFISGIAFVEAAPKFDRACYKRELAKSKEPLELEKALAKSKCTRWDREADDLGGPSVADDIPWRKCEALCAFDKTQCQSRRRARGCSVDFYYCVQSCGPRPTALSEDYEIVAVAGESKKKWKSPFKSLPEAKPMRKIFTKEGTGRTDEDIRRQKEEASDSLNRTLDDIERRNNRRCRSNPKQC